MAAALDHAAILRDPAWLAHRYDAREDAVQFRRHPRAEHRAAVFITDEYLPQDRPLVAIRRTDALAAAPAPAPIHFIFHSAFCCSTLLARALDREGVATALKEPVLLNDIVGWRRRGAGGAEVAMRLDHGMQLLARPFGAGEAVVVKPSNIVNALAPVMLAMRPGARAILLHAPLRTFLASVARKGIDGRLWVRELFLGQRSDGLLRFGFDDAAYFSQTDLQVAAIGWLAQHALFADLVARFGAERVRTLDSEALLATPERALAATARLFGLAMDDAAVAEVAAGSAFNSHSKSGAAFDAEDRADEYRRASDAHADEIDKVCAWADAVAASAGVAMAAPAPLLG